MCGAAARRAGFPDFRASLSLFWARLGLAGVGAAEELCDSLFGVRFWRLPADAVEL